MASSNLLFSDEELFTPPQAALEPPLVLSVSQLNEAVKLQLETAYPSIWVSGEISNLSCPSSGHLYFSLKDHKAQVRCAFFKAYQMRSIKAKNGDQVKVLAMVSLYPDRGDYQLIVKTLELEGLGSLQQRFEELKKRLHHEGLFNPEHKKKIPAYPKTIGLITSASGAALQDMLHVFERRYPIVQIKLFPSLVQGLEAPAQLISMLKLADQSDCDCLIIARGGGSIEDLWAFNDEALARTIFALNTPIISGVGHEIDFTIADFVADLRAPTPSVAAELATPNQVSLQSGLKTLEQRLKYAIQKQLLTRSQALKHLGARLKHPKDRLLQQHQRLDFLTLKLQELFKQRFKQHEYKMRGLIERLQRIHPERRIHPLQQRIDLLKQQLKYQMERKLTQKVYHFQNLIEKLNVLNPLQVLERGFAIAKQGDKILTSIQEVRYDQNLLIRLRDGVIITQVVTTSAAQSGC